MLSYKKPKGLPLTAGEKVTFPLNPKRTAYSSVTNVSSGMILKSIIRPHSSIRCTNHFKDTNGKLLKYMTCIPLSAQTLSQSKPVEFSGQN